MKFGINLALKIKAVILQLVFALLFLFSCEYFFASNTNLQEANKLKAAGDAFKKEQKTDEFLSAYKKAGFLYRIEKNTPLFSETNQSISKYYLNQGQYDSCLKYLDIAIAFFSKENNLAKLADTYNMVGIVYQHQGDYQQGLDYLSHSARIFRNLNDTIKLLIGLLI